MKKRQIRISNDLERTVLSRESTHMSLGVSSLGNFLPCLQQPNTLNARLTSLPILLAASWVCSEVHLQEKKLAYNSTLKNAKIKASSPITSWQIDGENVETLTDISLLGSKITEEGDYSHEIKRHLLQGIKAMNKPRQRDITLPTKVNIVKAMFFPVVMYGCESWTIKEGECLRIDSFKLWCCRRL